MISCSNMLTEAPLPAPAIAGSKGEMLRLSSTFGSRTRCSVLVCSCGSMVSVWCSMLFEFASATFCGDHAAGPASTARVSRRTSSAPGLAGSAVRSRVGSRVRSPGYAVGSIVDSIVCSAAGYRFPSASVRVKLDRPGASFCFLD